MTETRYRTGKIILIKGQRYAKPQENQWKQGNPQ